MSSRKDEHIKLAKRSQHSNKDYQKCYYEPLLYYPTSSPKTINFFNYTVSPLFISSMTAGGKNSLKINTRLANAAYKFKIPFALGSCRKLLESNNKIEEFSFRNIIKDKAPIIANIGISQIEQLLIKKEIEKIDKLVQKIDADAIAIHINILQEFFQPEGDVLTQPLIKTIKQAIKELNTPVIIKEVGQGMGPQSIELLKDLEIAAFETASLGGTNFSKIETLRSNKNKDSSLLNIGHTTDEMCSWISKYKLNCPTIISGGVKSMIDEISNYQLLNENSFIGMAYQLLIRATKSQDELNSFIENQLQEFNFAQTILKRKD